MCVINATNVIHGGTCMKSPSDIHGMVVKNHKFAYPFHKNVAQLHKIYVIIEYKECQIHKKCIIPKFTCTALFLISYICLCSDNERFSWNEIFHVREPQSSERF